MSREHITVYYRPDRDGDVDARLKAEGMRHDPHAMASTSRVALRLILERLDELESTVPKRRERRSS